MKPASRWHSGLLATVLASMGWLLQCQEQVKRELDAEALHNIEYFSDYTESGRAVLNGGEYREAIANSSVEVVVRATEMLAMGNLDGQPAAAIVLVTTTGGSGSFFDVAIVQRVNNELRNIALTSLGDRVKIRSIELVEDLVHVEMVTHSVEDPMCCPTLRVQQSFALEGNELRKASEQLIEKLPAVLSDSAIVGIQWQLIAIDWQGDSSTVIDDPSRYTLRLAPDGRVELRADCNRGFGSYSFGNQALRVEVGGLTRAACPPGSLAPTFVDMLGSVSDFSLKSDDYTLTLHSERGLLRFERS